MARPRSSSAFEFGAEQDRQVGPRPQAIAEADTTARVTTVTARHAGRVFRIGRPSGAA